MSKPTHAAFPLLSKSQLLISLAMLTMLFLALTAEGEMKPASSFSATNDCLIGPNFPISQVSGRQEVPAIAYNSQNNEHLAIWQNKETPSADWNICGQVITDTTSVPDEPDFCILAGADQQSPALAYNSNDCQYLMVWQDDRESIYGGWDIWGQLVSCMGEPMGEAFGFFKLPGRAKDQRHPVVVYNSTDDEYLVVWQDKLCYSWPYDTADDIYGWRVSSEGKLIGNAIPISIATDCQLDVSSQQSPVVAYNSQDNQYLVVWEDNRNGNWDIYGQLLTRTGDPLGSDFPIITDIDTDTDQRFPDLVYNSQDNLYLVVWQDSRHGNWDVYGRRVLSDGTKGNDFRISWSAGAEQIPAVAYNGDHEYLVAWQDKRNGAEDIYGQRVGSNDSLLGSECPISTAANDQESPDVAYNSQNKEYMAVWQDERNGEDNDDIYGQLVVSVLTPTPTPTQTPTPTETHTPTPTSTPTPTPTETHTPTPTGTYTPTPTPTPTSTSTPTATPTPTRCYLYLPLVMQNHAVAIPFCNGDFENDGFSCWTPGGNPFPSVVDHLHNSDPPHSGQYCALLGESIFCEARDVKANRQSISPYE